MTNNTLQSRIKNAMIRYGKRHDWTPADELKHPRDSRGRWAQVRFHAMQVAELNLTQEQRMAQNGEFNDKFTELERASGMDGLKLLDKVYSQLADLSHEAQISLLNEMIEGYEGKPKDWEPPNPMPMDKYDDTKVEGESADDEYRRHRKWQMFNHVRQQFVSELTISDVTNHKKTKYLETAQKVLARMTVHGLESMARNLKGVIFYPDVAELTTEIGSQVDISKGGMIGGAWVEYSNGHGNLHLDGGFPKRLYQFTTEGIVGMDFSEALPEQGIYAHEFGHVCDYIPRNDTYGRPISKTPEWQSAFQQELARQQLSIYAATSHAEGFAEFARLCWGDDRRPQDKAKEYPKCYKVFSDYGLMPEVPTK